MGFPFGLPLKTQPKGLTRPPGAPRTKTKHPKEMCIARMNGGLGLESSVAGQQNIGIGLSRPEVGDGFVEIQKSSRGLSHFGTPECIGLVGHVRPHLATTSKGKCTFLEKRPPRIRRTYGHFRILTFHGTQVMLTPYSIHPPQFVNKGGVPLPKWSMFHPGRGTPLLVNWLVD